MGWIYKSGKASAVLATILAVIIVGAFALPKAAAAYTEKDSDLLYSTEKVVMKGMPVQDKDTKKPITEPIKFRYWDATLQEFQGVVTSKNGVLPDVELFKGHHYIFYAEDANYTTYNPNGKGINIYLVMNATGSKAINDRYYAGKGSQIIDAFLMTKRSTPEADPENAKRVDVSLPVFYEKDDSDDFDFGNTKIRFTSDTDVVEVPIKFGYANAKLIEDMNYTVTAVSDDFTLDPFPLTVKDHSEDGRGKAAYMHFSCSAVSYIFLKDKSDAHNKDTTITSTSGNTSITGTNFMKGNYILRDRILNKEIPELKGKDYQVVDIDTINLYRNELSKIAAGDFKVTTKIPAGKTVSKVYYIDKNGTLHEVPSKQDGEKVTFDMHSVGVYNNVILFKDKNAHEFEVSINGYANWKDAHTIEANLSSDDFTIPEGGASHVYLMSYDGSERVYLTKDDQLIKQGNKLIVKLKNKSYHDYNKFTEFGLSVGAIESADGGAMKSAAGAHLGAPVKFTIKSISYEKPLEKEYNAGTIVANITGKNLYFGEPQGTTSSILPEVTINGQFIGSINGQLKFDIKVIDDEHAKITVSNIPENTTGKDQKWAVRINRGWAIPLTPETGGSDYVTIKAKSGTTPTPAEYTVTFNSNDGSAVANQIVKQGDKASKPADPTKNGYIFAGWYADSACTVSFNFDNPITANTTVYAKWTKKPVEPTMYTVAFDSNGGSAVASQTVKDGEKAVIPAVPTKAGHKFDKWMNGAVAYNFDAPVKGNLTLTASWIANTYNVSFDTDGGSAVANQNVKYGDKASKPADPTKKGYVFAGWYTDKGYKAEFDFTKGVMTNTTVYAKWNAEAPQPVADYKFTDGKDAVWKSGDLKFKVENPDVDKNAAGDKVFDRFLGIEVDGKPVDKADYTTKPGSLEITLKENFLRTLGAGRHSIKVNFRGGESAATNFTVVKAGTAQNGVNGVNKGGTSYNKAVKTGDSSNSFADALVLLLSGSTLAGIAAYRRKRA